MIWKFYEAEIDVGRPPTPTLCQFVATIYPKHIPADYMEQHAIHKNQYLEDQVNALAGYAQQCNDPLASPPPSPTAAGTAAGTALQGRNVTPPPHARTTGPSGTKALRSH